MKKIYCILITLIASTALCFSQNDEKNILDKTSSLFSKSEGVRADFTIQVTQDNKHTDKMPGNIRINIGKFVLETPSGTTWFNGETQWSYIPSTEEVNISNPTEEELRFINPYLLLNTYNQGYSCQLGNKSTFEGKQIYEIKLKPESKNNDIRSIVLYIQKSTYHPLYIEVTQKDKTITKVTVANYQFKQNFPDSIFIFDKKKFPDAEEIDLR